MKTWMTFKSSENHTLILPRMLVTFDTELRPLPVSVRVGNAVDVVGQVRNIVNPA